MIRLVGFLRGLGRVVVLVLGWGLALVSVLVVLSFVGCSLMVERNEAQEAARRASCHWTDPVIVAISGRVLAVPATGHSYVTATDGTHLRNETVDAWQVTPRRHAFCLDALQTDPLDAIRVSVRFDAAVELAAPFGLAPEHLLGIDLWRAGTMARRWPPPAGDPGKLVVHRTDADNDWIYLAAGGTGIDGVRLGGKCARTHDQRRSCRLWVEDAEIGLSYEFASLWIDDRDFDGAPVPEEFRATALKLRALVMALEADAVGRAGAPE